MLLIGTAELAEACYTAWLNEGPMVAIETWHVSGERLPATRLPWKELTPADQQPWLAVAEAAAKKLTRWLAAA
jgi:hypothetical protein